ncbi:MAG TPA: RagB/SusD family nutrient uptake outer membrane protein, partial [Chryseosolibacter sp.]|nr:RagB/SusD family nutrient uptake outer membrane protein [Chryseosolibacter sp.]
MKRIKYFFAIFLVATVVGACEDFLDKAPLDNPTTASFLATESEMNASLAAVYRSIHWDRGLTPFQQFFDLWSDIGQFRDPGIATGVFDTYNPDLENLWEAAYKTIQRANTLIVGMEQGKDNVNPEAYNRIQAEARTIRAWAYYNLAFMFGDVPLVTGPLLPEEYKASRTPQAEVIEFMLSELRAVAPAMPWKSDERGRIGRGVALGLKARVALTAGRFDEAAEA